MKPQDLVFLAALVGLLFTKKPKWLVVVGLICLVAAIPLFSFWIFFTAQRLVYYALGLFLAAVIIELMLSFKDRNAR